MAGDNRTLGMFKLEGIPPAPRGVPQIEVAFDIDANGILNVSAKDMATGKEQKITISGSTSLAKEEIDRMVHEADAHGADDKKRREKVEAANQADSLAYQVERQLQDLGDSVASHERARCEQLIGEIRQAVKEDAPVERLRSLMSDLQQAAHGMSAAAYQQSTGGASAQSSPAGGSQPTGTDEDVIDAEFEERQ
jgi:molecular chaperone DnaK